MRLPAPAPPQSTCIHCKKPADWLLEVTRKPLCTTCYTRIIRRRARDALHGCSTHRIISLQPHSEDLLEHLIPTHQRRIAKERTEGRIAQDACIIILATADTLARLLLAWYVAPTSTCGKLAAWLLNQEARYPLGKTSTREARLLVDIEDISCPAIEDMLAHLIHIQGESVIRSLSRVFQQIRSGTALPDPAESILARQASFRHSEHDA